MAARNAATAFITLGWCAVRCARVKSWPIVRVNNCKTLQYGNNWCNYF